MGSQIPPPRMMIPCAVVGETVWTVGACPASAGSGVAVADAAPPSAARTTTAGSASRAVSELSMGAFRVVDDSTVRPAASVKGWPRSLGAMTDRHVVDFYSEGSYERDRLQ